MSTSLQAEITLLRKGLYKKCETLASSLKVDDRIVCDNFSISAINRPTDKETWRIISAPNFITIGNQKSYCVKGFEIQTVDGAVMRMSLQSFIRNLYDGTITIGQL